MPVIHKIDAIKILMYFDDHQPPHFHVQYNEFEALILIETLDVYSGYLPPKHLKKVHIWAKKNKTFINKKWEEFSS